MVTSEIHFLLNQIKKNDIIFTHLMTLCVHVSIKKFVIIFWSHLRLKQKQNTRTLTSWSLKKHDPYYPPPLQGCTRSVDLIHPLVLF